MADKIIKFIKINNLQYNALRDPQVYRRVAGEPFRIQVVVAGAGESAVTLSDEKGATLVEGKVQAPGTFSHELAFAKPGVRIVAIHAQPADRRQSPELRPHSRAPPTVG